MGGGELWNPQLPKGKGGRALPKMKEYFQAALKYIYCWCNPSYSGKQKDIEIGTLEQPLQNVLGDKDIYEEKKSHLDVITTHTLSIWFIMLRIYKMQDHATK